MYDVQGRDEFLLVLENKLLLVGQHRQESIPCPVVGTFQFDTTIQFDTMLTTGSICFVSTPYATLHAFLFDPYTRTWTTLPSIPLGISPTDVDISDRDGRLFVAAFFPGLGRRRNVCLWTLVDGAWDMIMDFPFAPDLIGSLAIVVAAEAVAVVVVGQFKGSSRDQPRQKAAVWTRNRVKFVPARASNTLLYRQTTLTRRPTSLTRLLDPNWFYALSDECPGICHARIAEETVEFDFEPHHMRPVGGFGRAPS